jgi:hypothetical protein
VKLKTAPMIDKSTAIYAATGRPVTKFCLVLYTIEIFFSCPLFLLEDFVFIL